MWATSKNILQPLYFTQELKYFYGVLKYYFQTISNEYN